MPGYDITLRKNTSWGLSQRILACVAALIVTGILSLLIELLLERRSILSGGKKHLSTAVAMDFAGSMPSALTLPVAGSNGWLWDSWKSTSDKRFKRSAELGLKLQRREAEEEASRIKGIRRLAHNLTTNDDPAVCAKGLSSALGCSAYEGACTIGNYDLDSPKLDYLIFSVFISSNFTRPEDRLVMLNGQLYASAHGVGYVAVRTSLGASDPHWTKVHVLNRVLKCAPHIKHVYFLDGDAMFMDFSKDPRQYLVPMLGNASFLVGNHRATGDLPRVCSVEYGQNATAIRLTATLDLSLKHMWSCSPNTGSWLVRNTPMGHRLAAEWLSAHDKGTLRPGVFKCGEGTTLFDQGALNSIVSPWAIPSGAIRVVNGQNMNTALGKYVRHFLGLTRNAKAAKIFSGLCEVRPGTELAMPVPNPRANCDLKK